jgi:hypothetical protein
LYNTVLKHCQFLPPERLSWQKYGLEQNNHSKIDRYKYKIHRNNTVVLALVVLLGRKHFSEKKEVQNRLDGRGRRQVKGWQETMDEFSRTTHDSVLAGKRGSKGLKLTILPY